MDPSRDTRHQSQRHTLTGHLDGFAWDDAAERLARAVRSRATCIELDMRAVVFMSSRFATRLAALRDALSRRGVHVALLAPPAAVTELLDQLGLTFESRGDRRSDHAPV